MDLLNMTIGAKIHEFYKKVLGLISGVFGHDKIRNFSSISLKLCLLDHKNTGTWGVNNTLVPQDKNLPNCAL